MAKNVVLKGCLGGCAGLVVLAVLVGVAGHLVMKSLPPEQRAALTAGMKEKQASAEAQRAVPVDAFLNHFRELAAKVPAAPDLREQTSAAFRSDSIEYFAMDEGFLRQFTVQGLVLAPGPFDQPWYRGKLVQSVQGALAPSEYHQHRDDGALVLIKAEVEHAPYLVVVMPVEQHWPTLNADAKTFESGFFRGWAVLVDGRTWTPLGQTGFTARNSEKVTSLRVGLGGRLVGADLKEALENDFKDRFWGAVDGAVAHVCGREGKPTFASHRENFPTGG